MLQSIKILSPEIFLSAMAIVLLVIDVAAKQYLKRICLATALLALAVALGLVLCPDSQGRAFGMLAVDSFAMYFKMLAIFSCAFVLLLSEKDSGLMGKNAGTYCALLILSTVGSMFLASSEDLLMFFVGLELTTIPLFILTGFTRTDLRSSEGALKFFLMGAFSSGVMIYGISYLYGLCGTTHFSGIRDWVASPAFQTNPLLFYMGVLFFLAGLGFKFSLVPFHQWTPDAYQGAPTPVTAFFSVSREAGVLVVFLRFFSAHANSSAIGLTNLFVLLSVLTMTIGNITALRQSNLKRLLAYSSIAHAGTIFIAIAVNNSLAREGAMLYALAYLLMSLGAFAVVTIVSRIRKTDELSAVQGLAKENLPLALMMLFFLLSLSGIPPFLGFWGKFYVFAAAIQNKMYGLVAIGLINSVVAVYYYFRIAHKMFFEQPDESLPAIPKKLEQCSAEMAALFAAAAILILGIFPETILNWIQQNARLLP